MNGKLNTIRTGALAVFVTLALTLSLSVALSVSGKAQTEPTGRTPQDDIWGAFQPSEWVNDPSVICSVDVTTTYTNTLAPRFYVSTDGGENWLLHMPAEILTSTTSSTITLTTSALADVGFRFPEGDRNRVQFRWENSDLSDSPEYPVKVDTISPTLLVTVAFKSPRSFPVRWRAHDTGAGLHEESAYDVYFRPNGGNWVTWLASLPATTTSQVFGPTYPHTVTLGETIDFRVAAHDQVGWESSREVSTRIDQAGYLPIVAKNPRVSPTSTPTATPTATPTPGPTPAWQQIGLVGQRTRDVASAPDNPLHVYAASEVDGIHSSLSCGNNGTWRAIGPAGKFALSMLVIKDVSIDVHLVGTFADSLYRKVGGSNWQQVDIGNPYVWALVEYTDDIDNVVLAATDNGVFRSTDQGQNWEPWSDGLEGDALLVNDLLRDDNGDLWAATYGGGVYRSPGNNDNWSDQSTDLSGNALFTWKLIQNQDNDLLVATSAGVFQRNVAGKWESIGLNDEIIYSLAVDAAGALYAGTRSHGVFVRSPGATDWIPINQGPGWPDDMEVRDLLIAQGCNALFAATRDGIWRYPVQPRAR